MPATRLPKSRSAHTPQSVAVGNPPLASSAPANAKAHARFGHSFGQIAVTDEDTAPIQRQPEKNSCVMGEDDEFGPVGPPSLQSFFSGMMPPQDANNSSSIASQATPPNRNEAERQKIQADLQTKIFETTQDVTLNKSKAADKAYEKMDEYIRQ